MRTIVIGSGIVGASAAFHLRSAGTEVAVVDAGHPGKATLAGAGIVCPWASAVEDGPFFDLHAAGAAYYGELIGELADRGRSEVGYGRVGALVVSDDDGVLDAAERRVAARAAGRPEVGDVGRITPEEARDLFPPLRADLGALHLTGGARVDGRLLAEALLGAAGVGPADVHAGQAELAVAGDRVVGVRVRGRTIEADGVVVAAGAWAADLLRPLGLEIDVAPQKGQIVHLGLPGVETSTWPVLLPVGSHYLLAFDDSRVVVGATRETGSGFDVRVTATGLAEVLGAALDVAPGLADATVLETRVGLRPLTGESGGDPIIGAVPGVEGLLVGTGHGAVGLTVGPLTGRLLADLVLGRPVGLDIAPFAPPPAAGPPV